MHNKGMTTDRDKLRDAIERACVIAGKVCEERDCTITVLGGPKYIFTAEGDLKSIIKGGKSFNDKGERVVR
jgi:hypothetical protein